jgi:glucosyl-3-phosphoglycerate synthase
VTAADHDEIRVVVPPKRSVAELTAAKGGLRISVCLPARNEAATIAPICEVIADQLMGEHGLVDELLVLDDGSSDFTAAVATAAGAEVLAAADVLPDLGPRRGKGQVLWASIAACTGDIIVWCDSDLVGFDAHYITGLVAPLLDDPTVDLVKGYYLRLSDEIGRGGGRTTELMARPLLSRYFPALATLRQPLGGECAARRSLLEQLPFVESYGVEVGLLIDAACRVGVDALVQVDLGVRTHRHRSLLDLSEQAGEILTVVLDRADVEPRGTATLRRGDGKVVDTDRRELPPMASLADYRESRATGIPLGRPDDAGEATSHA